MTRSTTRTSRPKKPTQASPLEAHIGYWLRFVSNHVSLAFRRKVEGEGVTVAEWVILRQLYELGPTSPNVLGEAIGMTRGAISRLLDRVAAKKLVTRKVRSEDRRSQTVALTRSGAGRVPRLAALADENDDEFFSCIPDQDRAELVRILKDLVRAHALKNVPVE